MKHLRLKHVLPLSCLSLLVSAPLAQASGYCGKSGADNWDEIREALVGHWSITHQSGYAQAGGMVIPFPADSQVDVLTIALIGDELVASHPEMQAPMVLELADEPRWTMETDNPEIPKPTLTLTDLELVMGCDQMELPRIIGTTSAVVDGIRMDFVNRLILIDTGSLYGVLEVYSVAHGIPVTAIRTVSMAREAGN